MLSSRVAIVGLGGIFARAFSAAEFWSHLLAGTDTSSEVPPGRWVLPPELAHQAGMPQPDRVYSIRGCFIEGFCLDPTGLVLTVDELARLDQSHHLALHAGRDAWQDAATSSLDRRRVGVILGNIILPTDQTSHLTETILGRTCAEQILGPAVNSFPWLDPRQVDLDATPASVLARALGLGGPAFGLDAACASSLFALKLAVDELLAGRADAMLAGGVSRPDCLYTQMGFCQLRALSPRGRCAPFDVGGDGLVVGEGAGVFLLKRLEEALEHGDHIYAVIAGIGLSNDVGGNLLAPSSAGQLRAMRAAYDQAGWAPEEVDCIECHATGTPVGDTVEFNSLRELWRDRTGRPGQCVIGSVKSTFGHALTAAGAAGLLKLLLALRERTMPPTANYRIPRPEFELERSPFRVLTQAAPWPQPAGRPRRAAISGFGFGGTNAHLLLEEWQPAQRMAPSARPVALAPGEDRAPPPQSPTAVAVVATRGQIGTPASVAERWWGVESSLWFQREHGNQLPPAWLIEQVSAEVRDFHIPPRDLEEMLPQQLLMLKLAAQVLTQAAPSPAVRLRTGVFIGLTLDLNTTNYHLRWWLTSHFDSWGAKMGLTAEQCRNWLAELLPAMGPPLTPGRVLGGLASITASRIAREFGLGGPAFTITAGPHSGMQALHLARTMLAAGDIDLALVGAVDFAADIRAVLARSTADLPAGDGAVALLLSRGTAPSGNQVLLPERGTITPTLLPCRLGAAHDLVAWASVLGGELVQQSTISADDAICLRPGRSALQMPPGPFAGDRLEVGSLPPRASRSPSKTVLPPLLAGFVRGQSARSRAHAAHHQLAGRLQAVHSETLAWQLDLLRQGQFAADLVTVFDLTTPLLDRTACLEFAVGSIAAVLGPEFAEVDTLPTRVRLPAEPLMLVDRINALEGQSRSLQPGRIVTEHDVHPDDWYLDQGCIPAGLAIEAGQADLFLSAWLGIDFATRGLALYRLLDAEVTFHRSLPGPGSVLRYDIHIDQFLRQGQTHLFRFRFEGTIDGQPLLTMRDGCAGFFTPAALAAGQGIVQAARSRQVEPPSSAFTPLLALKKESYGPEQLQALRAGDLARCLGPAFARLPLREPCRLPGGRLHLLDRVTVLDPAGGEFGRGLIRTELDIDPQAWFLTCHFVDDMVMPGTLMYECCLHALRLYLMRLGWVGEQREVVFEPVPGVPARLRCRGQVIPGTRTAAFEVVIKQLGYRPEPFALADALMYADGKPIVEVGNLSLQLRGLTREQVEEMWRAAGGQARMSTPTFLHQKERNNFPLFDRSQVLEFATGSPVRAFGDRYAPFERQRRLARLPAPPYSFLDGIISVSARPWEMRPGSSVTTHYHVPADAWYFEANGLPQMPLAILLEIGFQSCGWLAAYLGSALHCPVDLRFRNLGGRGIQLAPVTPASGTLTTRATLTTVSTIGDLILQQYTFAIRDSQQIVYKADVQSGFFSDAVLARQAGLARQLYQPSQEELRQARRCNYPQGKGWPNGRLRLVDRVEWLPGGPCGLGVLQGDSDVDPEAWFFKAHFLHDPVYPGAFGLEMVLHLLRLAWEERFQPARQSTPLNLDQPVQIPSAPVCGREHHWTLRGQIVPANAGITVQAILTSVDEQKRRIEAEGWLAVDGLVIYHMEGLAVGAPGDVSAGSKGDEPT